MPTKAESVAGGEARARTSSRSEKAARNPLLERVVWQDTPDPDFPYAAFHAGHKWVVRLNDFPEESLFTLFIGGVEIGDFDDWPEAWERP